MAKFTYIEHRSTVGEWADEFFEHYIYKDADGEEWELIIAPASAVDKGEAYDCLLIAGAVDWEGNLDDEDDFNDFVKRYPTFYRQLLRDGVLR
jgi:hypothetical protein